MLIKFVKTMAHSKEKRKMSTSEKKPRYVRNWKCQISVGELYRWILAKLSDKDIKRALHKYRDLMPRQSDWNRKLTQATNIPELGFRYLYRCGQIDESNHRTMQKMLKYIDRQDVLPYFDTILYNTNHANCSLEELKANVLDKVEEFLKYSTCLSEEEVHPNPPYEIHQCQPLKTRRVTRSRSKRKIDDFENLQCLTSSKRVKVAPDAASSSSNLAQCFKSASSVCGQVRSSIMAAGIAGPAVHSHLASSIVSMLDALRVSTSTPIDLTSNFPDQSETLSPAALLATLPHLLAFTDLIPAPFLRLIMTAARNSPRIDAFFLSPHLNNSSSSQGQPQQQFRMLQPPNNVGQNGQEGAAQANGHHRFLNLGVQNTRGLASPVSGGVGITASSSDSCLLYYCRIRMRIRLDLGPTPDLRSQIQVMRQGEYEQQLEIFAQASSILNSRSPGEFLCYMRFNQLSQLESFWRDYQSGALRKALLDTSVPSFFQDERSANEGSSSSANQNAHKVPDWLAPELSQECPFEEHPFNALADSLKEIRLQISRPSGTGFAVPQQMGPQLVPPGQPVQVIQLPFAEQLSPDRLSLHLYISQREYENGRFLLMRNLRDIPSMSRLISASSYLPALMPQMMDSSSASTNKTNSSTSKAAASTSTPTTT